MNAEDIVNCFLSKEVKQSLIDVILQNWRDQNVRLSVSDILQFILIIAGLSCYVTSPMMVFSDTATSV